MLTATWVAPVYKNAMHIMATKPMICQVMAFATVRLLCSLTSEYLPVKKLTSASPAIKADITKQVRIKGGYAVSSSLSSLQHLNDFSTT